MLDPSLSHCPMYAECSSLRAWPSLFPRVLARLVLLVLQLPLQQWWWMLPQPLTQASLAGAVLPPEVDLPPSFPVTHPPPLHPLPLDPLPSVAAPRQARCWQQSCWRSPPPLRWWVASPPPRMREHFSVYHVKRDSRVASDIAPHNCKWWHCMEGWLA